MSMKISLRANNGLWVCAEGGGGREVVANRAVPREWETFELTSAQDSSRVPSYGEQVHLKASNGQYICAEGGGGREVVANRAVPREWETFTLRSPTGQTGAAIKDGALTAIALQTWNGNFVCAEGGGGREVVANRTALGPWETFSLLVAGKGALVPKFPITAVRDDQVTPGNHMHTSISLDQAGQLSGSTHTWTDNYWQGVHAVSNVAFLDENCQALWTSQDCICGVAGKMDPTGPHDRVCNFSWTVPQSVLPNIKKVAIVHRADPHSLFLDWLGSTEGKVVIGIVAAAVVLTVAGSLAGPA